MKLQPLYPALLEDFKAVIAFYLIDVDTLDITFMWQLLHVISCNRAYDDTHPRWIAFPRILPYDGRDYCWYYATGANDSHVVTLLRAIMADLKK